MAQEAHSHSGKSRDACTGVLHFAPYARTLAVLITTAFPPSSHSTCISHAGHIMTLLFKILPSAALNQIIFSLLLSVNNSCNSLPWMGILLIIPGSLTWVLPYPLFHFFKN